MSRLLPVFFVAALSFCLKELNAARQVPHAGYIKGIAEVLQSDPSVRARLSGASPAEIKSGQIAIEFSEEVQKKLEAVKYKELERLMQGVSHMMMTGNLYNMHKMQSTEHIDHGDLEHFTREDLKKIIEQVSTEMTHPGSFKAPPETGHGFGNHQRFDDGHGPGMVQTPEEDDGRFDLRQKLVEAWEESGGHMHSDEFNMEAMFMKYDRDTDGANDGTTCLEPEKERQMWENVDVEIDRDGDKLISLDEWMGTVENL